MQTDMGNGISIRVLGFIMLISSLQLRIGRDIGIISFDDKPFKELLGLTTIERNSAEIGTLAAKMILSKKMSSVESNFDLIMRESA